MIIVIRVAARGICSGPDPFPKKDNFEGIT